MKLAKTLLGKSKSGNLIAKRLIGHVGPRSYVCLHMSGMACLQLAVHYHFKSSNKVTTRDSAIAD